MRTEQLREVIRDRGPFVSVYLDASHDTEDALTRNELRWRAAESRLSEIGADQATIDATKQAMLDRPAVGQAGRAVIAAHGEVLLTEDFPVPPAVDVVRYSPLPYLLPLLSSFESPVPHVIVLADKTGARFRAVDADGAEHRIEEPVEGNAKEIAEQTARLADRVNAELVVVAGTIATRTAVQHDLPQHVRELAVELDVNSAHTDLDAPDVTGGVTRFIAQRQAERDEVALERLHVGSAHGRACEGLARVTEALRAGAVETVLVTDPALAGRTVWIGADPSLVSTDAAELAESGEETTERRADEAVPAAALVTAADVLVLTGAATVTDGVAALLRF
jgi:hypothetical protein